MKTSPWVIDEFYWRHICQKVSETCNLLLAGNIGVIEASRELSGLRHELREEDDPDFITFVAIDSETDHLPIGRFREGWNAESLKQKDSEVQKSEAFYLESARESATNLLRKYKIEQTDAANRHPFGTSGMAPADPASRAGATPEASGDS